MGVIYSITNSITKGSYIGSSNGNGEKRWQRHKKDLRSGKHHSIFLQRAWNKYGESVFNFKVLEIVENSELLNREQYNLNYRKSTYSPVKNYNMLWVAGTCEGRIYTEEAKLKMSNSHKGKKRTKKSIIKQRKTWIIKYGKQYEIISPEDRLVKFNNIRSFCRKHNLNLGTIRLVLSGGCHMHKGWYRKGYIIPTYSYVSPNGIIFKNIKNLTEFAQTHNIRMKGLSKLHCNNCKSYLGWKKHID